MEIMRQRKISQQYQDKPIVFIDKDVQSLLQPLNLMQIIWGYPKYRIVNNVITLCFDTNMVYAIRIITLLKDKVFLWNTQVKNVQNMAESEKKYYCQNLFKTYDDILKCYDIYRICYQLQRTRKDFPKI
ncbi:uncharacterized protein LOC111351053 [Spodoptera litura]|uniref:Uncharacterized protein LOC111351053 n=1 Tax=Spodoptera litura TaxID=69820 RepID=A0A9J7DU57_SPOLT|nr:uncharacterized protein LOC111351053 [Spodoptera litura]